MAAGKEVLIIDVRSASEYASQHIDLATNINLDNLLQIQDTIKKNTFVVTACGNGGGRSKDGAQLLRDAGFTRAHWLCGGTFGWL